MVEPIVDYSEIAGQPAKCDRAIKPKVHAILIGTTDAGPPFNKLVGPDNDVELIGSSLSSRGVADDDIFVLVGDDASREIGRQRLSRDAGGRQLRRPRAALFQRQRLRARSTCSTRCCRRNCSTSTRTSSISDIWNADLYAPEDRPTAAIRWAERAGLYLALDQQQEGVLDVLSAPDISDFVTNLRNREVDVTVALDTSYATDADLAGRQAQVGDTTIWSIETSGDGEVDAAQEYVAADAAAAQSRWFRRVLCQRRRLACARVRFRGCGRQRRPSTAHSPSASPTSSRTATASPCARLRRA